jgi:hypothetical protein
MCGAAAAAECCQKKCDTKLSAARTAYRHVHVSREVSSLLTLLVVAVHQRERELPTAQGSEKGKGEITRTGRMLPRVTVSKWRVTLLQDTLLYCTDVGLSG